MFILKLRGGFADRGLKIAAQPVKIGVDGGGSRHDYHIKLFSALRQRAG